MSVATVRVFVQGQEVYVGHAELAPGDFWEVGELLWPAATVTPFLWAGKDPVVHVTKDPEPAGPLTAPKGSW